MADVASTLPQWSTTRGDNKPNGATTIGTGMDNNYQEMQGVIRGWLASKGADIASATTTDLGAIEGFLHDITGTTTITGFGTVSAGITKKIKFEDALTLTHSSNLILRHALNHLTADGDVFEFISEGSGVWRETSRSVAGGDALPGTLRVDGAVTAPAGWLFCYGQAVSRATYSAIFARYSTLYGVGDGSTTFNLPDLRGRVVAGQDDMGGTSANRLTGVTGSVDGDVLGGTGGEETHVTTTAEMPAHTHSDYYQITTPTTGSQDSSVAGTPYVVSIAESSGLTTTGSTGGGGAHNNVQPTIVLNWLIKT